MKIVAEYLAENASAKLWFVLFLIILSSFLEGIGVATILPVLSIAIGENTVTDGTATKIANMFGSIGIPFELGPLLIVLVTAIILKSILRFVAILLATDISGQVTQGLRVRFMNALAEVRWRYFITQPKGHLTNTVSLEIERAGTGINALIQLFSNIFLILFYISLAFWISWKVTIVVLVAGATFGLLARLLINIVKSASGRGRVALQTITGELTDVLSNFKPFRSMDNLSFLGNLKDNAYIVRKSNLQQAAAGNALKQVFEPFVAILLAIGLYIAISKSVLTVAELIFTCALFQRSMTYIGSLNSCVQRIARLLPFIQNVKSMISEAEANKEDWGGSLNIDLNEKIEMENVSFSYPNIPVLRNFSVCINKGELTTFLGPSGSGKTTCVDLVCGLHRPENGRILIDGVELDQISIDYWRRQIGYVTQEPVLFNNTIAANVAFGSDDQDIERIERALELTGMLDFVNSIPDGINSNVGEHGQALSGGQRQRIAIARALYRDPGLLILDEATSALDPDAEKAVCVTLNSLKSHVTMLAISHRPAIAEIADHVEHFQKHSAKLTLAAN